MSKLEAIEPGLALEQDLIGCAFFAPPELADSAISPEHFSEPAHGRIWSRVLASLADGLEPTPSAIASDIGNDPGLSGLGGLPYLLNLIDKAPPVTAWPALTSGLIKAWRTRRLTEIGLGLSLAAEAGRDTAQLLRELEAVVNSDPGGKPRFEAINFHDLRPEPQAWRIKNILPSTGVGFIGGPTKAGKSFLALDLGLRLAAGASKVLSRRARPCGVVYIAAEDPEGCKYRAKAWEKRHHRQTPMPFDLIPQPVNLLDDGQMEDLRRTLRGCAQRFEAQASSLGVIVLDTLSRCLSGADENSSADMGRAFAALAGLSRATGALVLVVAHFGKSGQERGIRGHSSLDANSEATISVERSSDDPDLRIVTLAKVKNGVDGGQLAFRLEEVGLGLIDEDGEEIVSCVPIFEPLPEGTKAKRGKALTKPENLVLAAVRYVTDHGQIRPLPADIEGAKPWMKAVDKGAVKDRAVQSGLAGDDKPNTVRVRFDRAIEGLIAAGKIRQERQDLWLL